MVVEEPGFSVSQWAGVFDLPKIIADLRCARATSINKIMESPSLDEFSLDSTEILWKPTMDVLLEEEEIKSKARVGYSSNGESLGCYVLERIVKPMTYQPLHNSVKEGPSLKMTGLLLVMIKAPSLTWARKHCS
ncbi:hypothetical protein CGRA01v4_14413 [Colletotrichum graminicola]|uniref:Uncharacterized protein n=1 Tax=Colletotrichum graminicola (strain M1.001 / M2 / FGSC 10212) TaxID=645133 RepID=E3Q4I2_COLGM|nr:uncharacterized protein GLRG_01141 [Colletotrichum graminicola M1.001]EFQ25997.1 hypothetical protein GLRG_01141 [Colletotrichum graminicola M1.001]WDK23122.1 hypothetical protein CGRA01v4_14413 [Colletotrichum graminicola]